MSSINPTESVINSISNFSDKSKIKQDPNEKSFSSLLNEHLTTIEDYNTTTATSSNDSSISNTLISKNEQKNSISTTTNTLEKPSITGKDNLTTEKKALTSQEENKNNSINPNLQAELLIANNNFTNYDPELRQVIKESSISSKPAVLSNSVPTTQNVETLLKASSNTKNTIASDISTSGNDLKLPKHAVDFKESSLSSTPVDTQNGETLLKSSSKIKNNIASDMSTSENDLNAPISATLLNNISFENKIGADISNPPISNNVSTTNYQINTNLYQSGWNEAFNQRVILMTHNNINSASISINPEHLGPIQVQLQMDANQQTSIHFIADNPDVRQAIND